LLRSNLRPANRPKKTDSSAGEQKAEYELTKGWRELHKDEFDKLCFSTNYRVDKLQENEMGEQRRRIWQNKEIAVKRGVEAT
jgi:hypothetical protein